MHLKKNYLFNNQRKVDDCEYNSRQPNYELELICYIEKNIHFSKSN